MGISNTTAGSVLERREELTAPPDRSRTSWLKQGVECAGRLLCIPCGQR